MSAPTSKEEYEARFMANQEVVGFGPDVATIMPCPFCAAPLWLKLRIMDFEQKALQEGATCLECGRSAKGLVTHPQGGGVSVEMVQTGGDDPPPWIPPIRRIDGEGELAHGTTV
jgi:hypothetical protein